MTGWLSNAIEYVQRWLEYQLMLTHTPGAVLAVAHRGEVIAERAFGMADLAGGSAMTVDHAFRVASHSKTFTAAGILRLCELGRLGLADEVGKFLPDLPKHVARLSLHQLVSHGSGLMRDGDDAAFWHDRGEFPDRPQLLHELARPLTFPANSRFKYSNLGFGLLGQVIEAATGEAYAAWIAREIVAPAGLRQTSPDLPSADAPMAVGYGQYWPGACRLPFPPGVSTRALASATGFTSVASDLVKFFACLDPSAGTAVLSPASRRMMIRRHWEVPQALTPRWYGLGTLQGEVDGRRWFGHWGAFPGFSTRTSHIPEWDLTFSLLINAIDRQAVGLGDAIIGILSRLCREGSPSPTVRGWSGRWWTIWAPADLVPAGDKVLVADPSSPSPLAGAMELTVSDEQNGRISLAEGTASDGERVTRRFDENGRQVALWLGGNMYLQEPDFRAGRAK